MQKKSEKSGSSKDEVPSDVVFEAEFVNGLTAIFEDKIVFNCVLGLKITSLLPNEVRARIDMKPDLVGH
jgi:hypothetical protein